MIQHHVRVVALAAAVLLLSACAPCARCLSSAKDKTKDTKYPNWNYVETKIDDPFWWAELVGVKQAHANGVTGAGTTVAIVGTGVLRPHEDLPNIAAGEATCGKPPTSLDETNGHGTQLAGIALGRADKSAHATFGVAPDATLIPVKVDCGAVTAEALTKGIDAAIARTPDVILIAIGGYPAEPPGIHESILERVIRNPKILFVVASAWDGTNYVFPKWTQETNALLVAAMTFDAVEGDPKRLDKSKEIAYSSRRGDIWAPGRSVGTADVLPRGGRVHDQFLMHGTSPAAAIVAGCAALVKSKSPSGTGGAEIKEKLKKAAEEKPDIGPPPNIRLNCAQAVP